MATTITAQKNRSLKVEGDVEVYDDAGNLLKKSADNEQVFLCRCGHSKDKPFCDGSHNTCGFTAP